MTSETICLRRAAECRVGNNTFQNLTTLNLADNQLEGSLEIWYALGRRDLPLRNTSSSIRPHYLAVQPPQGSLPTHQ